MAAGRHFKFANFDTLSRDRFQNENLRQHTKSHFKKKTLFYFLIPKIASKPHQSDTKSLRYS